MKTHHLFFYFLALFFLAACSGNKPETSVEMPKHKVPYVLNSNNLFNRDSIEKALKVADNMQKSESRKMFMLGLDLLANKNQPEASVEYFKEAIYFYPDSKSYLFLFDAYLKSNNYLMADSANSSALYAGGQIEEVAFNSALVAAAKEDTANCLASLDEAFFYGFINKDKVLKEPLFDFVKDKQGFQALVVANFGDEEVFTRKLFASYLKFLPDLNLPFEIPVDSVATYNHEISFDYDYASFIPDMLQSEFSRDVSNSYMVLGKFKITNGHAVLYKMFDVIADTLNPVSTYIITYDTLGKTISNEVISCFCSPLERKSCTIGSDFKIHVTSYKTEWEKNPAEAGYANNKIISNAETGKEILVLNTNNEVIRESKEELASSKN